MNEKLPVPAETQKPSAKGALLRARDLGILLALVALIVWLSIASPVFLTPANLLNVAAQWAPVAIMALGGTAILIAGGFDLSTGAMYVVSGIAAASTAAVAPVPVAMLAGVACGLGLGMVNGLLSTVGRMNVFVATLGSSIVFTGMAVAFTGGVTVIVREPAFGVAQSKIGGVVQPSILVAVAVVVLTWFLFRRTVAGRHLYATGGNPKAARLAGVNTSLIKFAAFAFAGFTAGIAAVLVTSMSMSASTSSGTAMAYNVWTAMLIGGNSMRGGEGRSGARSSAWH